MSEAAGLANGVALPLLFGDQLGSLPLALRALAISGMLVAFMANVPRSP